MPPIPPELKYTNEHEWLRMESGLATVGITDYAQKELGDIVFVELPALQRQVKKGESLGSLEAVKTVVDIYAPVSGQITEVNSNLNNQAGLINQDPYGEGWMVKIKPSQPDEFNSLLDAQAYQALTV